MNVSKMFIGLSSAFAFASSIGLAEIVNAHDTKEKPAKLELKTLQELGIPIITGSPYRKERDFTVRVNGRATNVEYFDVNGNIVIRNVLDGKVYVVFVCRAPPNSKASFYFSPLGNGLFENLSPLEVPCDPADYK